MLTKENQSGMRIASSNEGSIVVQHIVKRYGKKKEVLALNDISFDVQQGELFGIIGPDGAGKTSLFRILTTLLLPDNGIASVDGFDVVKDYKSIRNRVGYMPGKFSLYHDLSVEENINFFATIFNTSIRDNYDLIKDIYIQIEPFRERKAGKLSGGMKQKLALCCALIHRPSVLFLDEPTTGVDAVSRREFWEMLKGLKQRDITILVSTPYMDEADLCDRVALIQDGQLLSIDTPAGIVSNFKYPLWAVKSSHMLQLLNDLNAADFTKDVYPFGEFHHVVMKNESGKQALDEFIKQHQYESVLMKEVGPNIEDCFIALMKNKNDKR